MASRKEDDKHTPLPWYDGGSAQEDGEEWQTFFISSPPNCIATCPEKDGSSKANADFILRACNSHYALVEALENLVPMGDNDSSPLLRVYAREFEAARAAIAKAKGEA